MKTKVDEKKEIDYFSYPKILTFERIIEVKKESLKRKMALEALIMRRIESP